MKRNVVCDYNTITSQYLKDTHNIKVLSYFFFEFMKFNIDKERIYDVAFIGSSTEKRKKIIQDLQERFPHLIFYIDFEWSHKSPESMTDILHQCKTVLNIPYYENNALETHRITKALACGCDVISLNSAEEDANQFFSDYVYMTDDLEKTVGEYFSLGIVNPDKKGYEELVKTLSQKFNPHLHFVIDQIHTKLLAL